MDKKKSIDFSKLKQPVYITLKLSDVLAKSTKSDKLDILSEAVAREVSKKPPKRVPVTKTADGGTIYKCHVCGSKFKKSFSLTRHMHLHTQHKPFKCLSCSYSFIQKSDLVRHIAVHSELKTVKCTMDGCK